MMDLDKLFEQIFNDTKPSMKATLTNSKGEVMEFTEDFLLISVGRERGMVAGAIGPLQLVKAVEMTIESAMEAIEEMPLCMQLELSEFLLDRINEKFSGGEEDA